jgi:cell division protein FtsW (lipid II flippase)
MYNFNIQLKSLQLFKYSILVIPVLLMVMSIWTLSSLEPSFEWWMPGEFLRTRAVKQFLFGILGIFIGIIFTNIFKVQKDLVKIIVFNLMVLALVLVVILTEREIKGASRWLTIGDFSLQPSEFAKVGMILWSSFLATRLDFSKLISSLVYWSFPLVFFILIWNSQFGQSDLGTAVVVTLSAVVIYMVSPRVARNYKLASVSLVLMSVALVSFNLVGYQVRRLDAFDFIFSSSSWLPNGADSIDKICNDTTLYNTCHAVALVANNNLFGSVQSFETAKTIFLPERQTDFIFASLSHFLGILGSFFTVILLFSLIYWLINLLKTAEEHRFYLILGVLSVIATQSILNIGMNLGLSPVVGVPLPWVSYGGSHLVASFMMIFLVLADTVDRKKLIYTQFTSRLND